MRTKLIPLATGLIMVTGLSLLTGCAGRTGATTASSPAGATMPPSNGLDQLPADEIARKGQDALAATKMLRAHGRVEKNGEVSDIDFIFNGGNAAATEKSKKSHLEIISVGQDLYVKASDDAWTGLVSKSTLATANGRYLKVDRTKPEFSEFADYIDIKQLLAPSRAMTRGETKTINGVPAVGVSDDSAVIYFSLHGAPLPLRLEDEGINATIEFTYDNVREVTAPAAADVYDITTLAS